MRKAISLFLALLMCLSLCACASETPNEEQNTTPPIETEPTETEPNFVEELTFGVWKKTLMSRMTLVFNKDGSGTMTSRNGASNTFNWRLNDSTISVITENNVEYTYTVDESKDYARILADDGLAYVKQANYDQERKEEQDRLAAEAVEIDWETIYNEYSANEVSAKAKYKGQPVKFKAIPANISEYGFQIFRRTSKSTGYMSVGMDSDLIASINRDAAYTFVGFLDGGYSFLSVAGTFVIEEHLPSNK